MKLKSERIFWYLDFWRFYRKKTRVDLCYQIRYQTVHGSKNICICRRAVAIVSKWSQEIIIFVAHKNSQYAYTYGTQNLINVNFFISDIQKIADVI